MGTTTAACCCVDGSQRSCHAGNWERQRSHLSPARDRKERKESGKVRDTGKNSRKPGIMGPRESESHILLGTEGFDQQGALFHEGELAP